LDKEAGSSADKLFFVCTGTLNCVSARRNLMFLCTRKITCQRYGLGALCIPGYQPIASLDHVAKSLNTLASLHFGHDELANPGAVNTASGSAGHGAPTHGDEEVLDHIQCMRRSASPATVTERTIYPVQSDAGGHSIAVSNAFRRAVQRDYRQPQQHQQPRRVMPAAIHVPALSQHHTLG